MTLGLMRFRLLRFILPAALALAAGPLTTGCSRDADEPGSASDPPAAQTRPTLTPELQATYDRTCKVCHGTPGTGAPAAGDDAAWASRIEQGIDVLLDHSINGYQSMPPMGLCMECSQDEFIAFIEYMTGLECD